MSIQRIWIPGPVPSLNELLAARGTVVKGRGRYFDRYNSIKQQWKERVAMMARSQRLQPVDAAWFTYIFFEPHKRRDPSNVIAAGVKLIEDGLQKADIIGNDGWRHVLGYAHYWDVDKLNPGTTVFLTTHSVLDKQSALWRDEQERVRNGQATRQA